MEYQKIMNLLSNMPNYISKFRTKNWVEINDDSCETYNTNSHIKFKTAMLKSSLQGSKITIKLMYVIKYACQNFGVCDMGGKIPKNRYHASYLLPSDFPNNLS